MKQRWIFAGVIVCAVCCIANADVTITVSADKPGAAISPTMWGIFFEDINFGADGGLYAELVKNRSFEFPSAMMGWTESRDKGADGIWSIRDTAPLDPANPRYLRLEIKNPREGYGVTNEGFCGIGVRQEQKYYFSVYARNLQTGSMRLTAQVVDPQGNVLAQTAIAVTSMEWKNYCAPMTASKTCPDAEFKLLAHNRGEVDVDMVSLFPADTAQQMNGRPVPGLRSDLVKMLADLKPGLFRFPGGCIVEGRDLDNRYQWKNTIGDINERKLNENRWNTEFRHRSTPDYFQSYGLGFYEYFVLAEQIGAQPLPILNCGMACQFNTGQLIAMEDLQPFVQDALDLIEFANGDASTTWGAKRAAMGHPEPFNMKYFGVGNEQWGPQYIERYKVFVKALKEKYPDIQLIGATGSDANIFPNGKAEVKYLLEQLHSLKADIIDLHYYRPAEWFLSSTDLYDKDVRDGSKIFVGEYAAMSKGVGNSENGNLWKCALAEAAFMTGLERNADLVTMTAYAPLFCNVNAWQWKPDLIWFNTLDVFATPNYFVQQAFSLNRGDVVLPVSLASPLPGLSITAARNNAAGQIILKVVNANPEAVAAKLDIQGAKLADKGSETVLSGDLNAENTFGKLTIAPARQDINITGNYSFKPQSLTILRLGVQQ